MKETNKSIQVFLKLNDGLMTRKVFVPKTAMTGLYRIPLKTGLNMHAINLAQPVFESIKTPTLVFKATGQVYQGTYIMDLVDVENL